MLICLVWSYYNCFPELTVDWAKHSQEHRDIEIDRGHLYFLTVDITIEKLEELVEDVQTINYKYGSEGENLLKRLWHYQSRKDEKTRILKLLQEKSQ